MTAPILRPYQERDVAAVMACLARGENPARQLPTGGGKTVEAAHVVGSTPPEWEWGIFVHRVELLRQMSGALSRLGIDHGIIAPGHELTSHRVHVASIDTVRARTGQPDIRAWLGRIRSLTDECHHAVAESWQSVLQLTRQRLGYTATPCRLDGRGLGDTGLFNRLIKGPSIAELTEAGYLAPGHVYAPPTGLDLSRVGKRGGDYVLSQLAAAVDTDEITAAALRWYDRVAAPVILAGFAPPPAIAFCVTVEHAERVAAAFRWHGVLARSVDGSMRPDERDAAIGGLADGSVQVLTSCALIGEGLDIPAVSAAILLRPTESTSLFLQQIGRSLRPHPDKSHATVLDLVGNTALHGMYDAERQWDLKGGLKGRERAVAGTWRCRTCHRVHGLPDKSGRMACGCGNVQTVRGFNPPAIESHPPIAGIGADVLLSMKWKDAQAAMKTYGDLVAFYRLYGTAHPGKCQNPTGMARMTLQQREQYRAKFRPGGRMFG